METVKIEEKYPLPEGNYTVVAWDMVATGGNLYDDICHLVAYTPEAELFSQHVMPYHNMSQGTRRRHSLNVINTGRYRILKDLRNNKVLRTKSCYSALMDFIEWLAAVKDTSDGIILVNHDSRRLISCILIEVLTNYNMQDRFCSIVKGFVNCCDIAESKCDTKAVRPFSIRSLSSLLNVEENAFEGMERVKILYKVVKHIVESSPEPAEGEKPEEVMTECQLEVEIQSYCCAVDGIYKMAADLKTMQNREQSLQPVFDCMKSNPADRQRSFNLQRLLARSNIDYEILSDIYKKGGLDAINQVLKCTMAQEHARELEELKHVFAAHFDPEYKGQWKPERPVSTRPRTFRRNSRNRRPRNSKGSPKKSESSTSGDVSVKEKLPTTPSVVVTPTTPSVVVTPTTPSVVVTNENNEVVTPTGV